MLRNIRLCTTTWVYVKEHNDVYIYLGLNDTLTLYIYITSLLHFVDYSLVPCGPGPGPARAAAEACHLDLFSFIY